VVVWRSDNSISDTNKVTLLPFTGILSQHVTSHFHQLSFLPSAGWDKNTSQGAVAMLGGWKVTIGLASQPWMADCGTSTYGLIGLQKGDEHPAYAPVKSMALKTDSYALYISEPFTGNRHQCS